MRFILGLALIYAFGVVDARLLRGSTRPYPRPRPRTKPTIGPVTRPPVTPDPTKPVPTRPLPPVRPDPHPLPTEYLGPPEREPLPKEEELERAYNDIEELDYMLEDVVELKIQAENKAAELEEEIYGEDGGP